MAIEVLQLKGVGTEGGAEGEELGLKVKGWD